jgi:hypothetical protein
MCYFLYTPASLFSTKRVHILTVIQIPNFGKCVGHNCRLFFLLSDVPFLLPRHLLDPHSIILSMKVSATVKATGCRHSLGRMAQPQKKQSYSHLGRMTQGVPLRRSARIAGRVGEWMKKMTATTSEDPTPCIDSQQEAHDVLANDDLSAQVLLLQKLCVCIFFFR